MDFSKFDKSIDLEGLKNDIEEAKENGTGDFKEVPLGKYEVKIDKLELTESKKHDPMLTCWMKILEGEYEGSMIFMNQVITQGFQIHIANEFLRSLGTEHDVEFESYSQYANLVMDIAEAIDGKFEYLVDYGQTKKGFNTFEIEDVYDAD